MAVIYLVVALVLVALSWVYVAWSKVRSFWAVRNVPHLPPHPLYGSLAFLQRENPGIWLKNLYNKFRCPYVGIWLFWRPAIVINSSEIARRVLVKDFDNFRNRLAGTGTEKTDPIGGLNLFCVNDPLWSNVRRQLTAVFTSAKLKSLHNLTLTKSKELVQRIANDVKQNNKMELRSLYADYTSDLIGTAAFGINCEATLTGTSPIRIVTEDFMRYDIIRGFGWNCIFFFPELAKLFRFTFYPRKSMAFFRKVYKAAAAGRGANITESNDLLAALLKMQQDAKNNNEVMDDDLVIAQAAVFLQGGFDTSACILAFLTYEIAFLPDAQEKLHDELLQSKNKLGDQEFNGTILSELPYLNSVIKETLRKYPPLAWLDRVASNDYKIDENLTIPAGTVVYVNDYGLHNDPEFFPEPEKFIPDRFMPENQKLMKPFTYMPFGEGPRSCIGTRFAFRSMWYALASIIMKYKIKPKLNAKKPSEIEIEKRSLLFMPGEELFVDFIPRE